MFAASNFIYGSSLAHRLEPLNQRGPLELRPQIMGSTGPNFVCPWCGRKNTSGYALDGINYPICSGEADFRCLSLLLQGISKNGIRAGALYHILGQSEAFRRIHGANPNFFLELCDSMYGMHEEYHSQMERLQPWENHYCLRGSILPGGHS